MKKNDKKPTGVPSRPESYPRPSQTDNQLKNQPEFIDPDPNEPHQPVSDVKDRKKEEEK